MNLVKGDLSMIRQMLWCAILATVVAICPQSVCAQRHHDEQTDFSMETEIVPVVHPFPLSRAALNALAPDKRVAFCLRENKLEPQQLPANWFVASRVHLDGPDEVDLVVQPSDRLPDTPEGAVSANACLIGANTVQFWILRKTQEGFVLVLSEIASELEIRSSRTHRLRDVRLRAVVGGYVSNLECKFDGQAYQIARRWSEKID